MSSGEGATAGARPDGVWRDLTPGRVVLHRQFTGDRLVFVRTARIVGNDARGVRLWLAHHSASAVTLTADGLGLRDMPFADWVTRSRVLTERPWRGRNLLMLLPPGQAHSVWWFWDKRAAFDGWYVNLEEPAVYWSAGDIAGIDSCDQDLDVWVYPDRRWAWKDSDELAERLAHPEHYWVADEEAVWAEGRRVIADVEAGIFPFDGTWCGFRPDPRWRPPDRLPEGWDRERARL